MVSKDTECSAVLVYFNRRAPCCSSAQHAYCLTRRPKPAGQASRPGPSREGRSFFVWSYPCISPSPAGAHDSPRNASDRNRNHGNSSSVVSVSVLQSWPRTRKPVKKQNKKLHAEKTRKPGSCRFKWLALPSRGMTCAVLLAAASPASSISRLYRRRGGCGHPCYRRSSSC